MTTCPLCCDVMLRMLARPTWMVAVIDVACTKSEVLQVIMPCIVLIG